MARDSTRHMVREKSVSRRLSVSVHHPNKFLDLEERALVVFTFVMEKDEVENLVAEKVNFAVRSSQNDLLSGIQQLISSEVEKLSESQKNFSELQLSKLAAITSSDYKFKRKSNEEQYKVNNKVLDKMQDCERYIEQADLSKAKANIAEGT